MYIIERDHTGVWAVVSTGCMEVVDHLPLLADGAQQSADLADLPCRDVDILCLSGLLTSSGPHRLCSVLGGYFFTVGGLFSQPVCFSDKMNFDTVCTYCSN